MSAVDALDAIDRWPVGRAAAAVVGVEGTVASYGPQDERFALASITKLFAAMAALVAVEEGTLDLDAPAGPSGSTVRHLLAHASGLGFEPSARPVAPPGARRVYSNAGYTVLAEVLAGHAAMPADAYVAQAVFEPLAMRSTSIEDGSLAAGAHGTVTDLVRFAGELLAPTIVSPGSLASATAVVFPGLVGVLPGFGRQDPCDWGLGFELRDAKRPHWTGTANSPRTYGHFGGAGTFIWVDPDVELACIVLTDREFGAWARDAWPPLSDALLAQYAA